MNKLMSLLFCYATIASAVTFESAFSPNGGCEALVIKTVASAKKTIYVAAYSFTSKPIAAALCEASNRGVYVNIVLDSGSNCRPEKTMADECNAAGCGVTLNGRFAILHDKYIVVDSSTIQIGSFNYSAAAEKSNAENVMVIYRAPKALVMQYLGDWQRLWKKR